MTAAQMALLGNKNRGGRGTLFLQAVSVRAPVPPTQSMGIWLGFDSKCSFYL